MPSDAWQCCGDHESEPEGDEDLNQLTAAQDPDGHPERYLAGDVSSALARSVDGGSSRPGQT